MADEMVIIEVSESHYWTLEISIEDLAEELEVSEAELIKAVAAYREGKGNSADLEDWIVGNYSTGDDSDGSYSIERVDLS